MLRYILCLSVIFSASCVEPAVESSSLAATKQHSGDLNIFFSFSVPNGQLTSDTNEWSASRKYNISLQYDTQTIDIKRTNEKYTYMPTTPEVYTFTDRPFKMASKMTMGNFMNFWSKGDPKQTLKEGTFNKVAPNAHIVYRSGLDNTIHHISGTLTQPQYSPDFGSLNFTLNPLPGSEQIVESGLFGDIFMSEITVFVDGFFSSLGGDIVHGIDDVATAVKDGFDDAASAITHLADESAADIDSAMHDVSKFVSKETVRIASDAALAQKLSKAAVDSLGEDFEKVGDLIKSGIVWLYDEEKCFYIEAGFFITGAFAEAAADAATSGSDTATWEVFVASVKEAATTAIKSEIIAKVVEKVMLAAGSSKEEADCADGLTDILVSQMLESVNYTGFAIDLIKEYTFMKSDCPSIFEVCK